MLCISTCWALWQERVVIHQFVQFITAHGFWAGPLVASVAFAEGLAVVGSFVPGSVILFAVGTSAGAAHLAVLPMIAWATIGAASGDTVSYKLGVRHGSRVLAMRPFAYKPLWTQRARDLLQRRGDMAVFGGRLFPPLRALMPLLAGMSELSAARFVIADLLAALVWAGAHLASGAILGHSLMHPGMLDALIAHFHH
jgi:membrane protein DedA with SNARE-associated domain